MEHTLKKQRAPWHWFDKFGVLVLIPLLVIFGSLWASYPTERFVKHISLDYNEETEVFTFVREVWPLTDKIREAGSPGIHGRYRSTINVTDDSGLECSSPWMDAFYQKKKGNTVTYHLGDWARPCLDAGPPFYVSTYRQVYLLGFIPVRMSRSDSQILPLKPDPNVVIVVPSDPKTQ